MKVGKLAAALQAVVALGALAADDEGYTFNEVCMWKTAELSGSTVSAYCWVDPTTATTYVWSSMDLNKCASNRDGILVMHNNGEKSGTPNLGYATSCKTCQIDHSETTASLLCDCYARDGNTKRSKLDLDRILTYAASGLIGCFDVMGTIAERDPNEPSG